MNNDRRKRIAAIKEKLEELQGLASDIRESLTGLADEERESFDNTPECLQSEKAEAAADALQEANDKADEIVGLVDEITGSLDTAVE